MRVDTIAAHEDGADEELAAVLAFGRAYIDRRRGSSFSMAHLINFLDRIERGEHLDAATAGRGGDMTTIEIREDMYTKAMAAQYDLGFEEGAKSRDEQIRILREALEWYADEANFSSLGPARRVLITERAAASIAATETKT